MSRDRTAELEPRTSNDNDKSATWESDRQTGAISIPG